MSELGSERKLIQRKEYYIKKVSESLREYPHKFVDFVINEKLIEFGDRLLVENLSTAYNIATLDQFPIVGAEPLILYSNYIQRKSHFGELLSRMEQEKVIKEGDVSFGIKGTKVIESWEDPELIISEITTKSGKVRQTSESVEAVIVFHPKSARQAVEIGRFLLTKARVGGVPYEIEGSWSIPDTRARQALAEALAYLGFKQAVANIYKLGKDNIITLRQKTSFKKEDWESFPILVNSELYDYLTAFGVEP